MTTNRREFIEHLGATAMVGALPLSGLGSLMGTVAEPPRAAAEWDFTWVGRLKGKTHKAVMDCTEVESGLGVWRASIWEGQYQEALGAKAAEIATVLVLRHNAVILAFQQDLWDSAEFGTAEKVTHPVTMQSTTRNPALLTSARDGIPAMMDAFALPNFLSRGGIVLACDLALQHFAARTAQKTGTSADEANKRFKAALVPGVLLMPSGVLGCVKAQQEGCVYVKAS